MNYEQILTTLTVPSPKFIQAFFDAVHSNNTVALEQLTSNPALNPSFINRRDTSSEYQFTMLHTAVKQGYRQCVNILIKAGADVNMRDDDNSDGSQSTDGDTPLQLACMYGYDDIVRDLVEAGAKMLSERAGYNPLLTASEFGWVSIVAFLAETFPEEVNRRNSKGNTPLSVACRHGHVDISKILLANGAFIDVRLPNTGNTPLHIASMNGHWDIVEILIDRGAKESLNTDGGTPSDVSFDGGYKHVILNFDGVNVDVKT